jgi:Tfp pilus assembly protein PilF
MRIYARTLSLFGVFVATAYLVSGCASTPQKKEMSKRERAQRLVQVADGAVKENDPTGALQYLQEAETYDATLPELHHVRALALIQKHEYPAAILSADKALRIMPDYAEASNTLGRLLMETGRTAEAIPHLQRAASNLVFRESYKADINLGILYYRAGKDALARKHLDHAILLAPQQACVAYYYKGHLDMKANKMADAISNYEKATLRFCGRFADAHLALGTALARDHQYTKARKKLLDVYKIFPDTPVARQAMEQMRRLP